MTNIQIYTFTCKTQLISNCSEIPLAYLHKFVFWSLHLRSVLIIYLVVYAIGDFLFVSDFSLITGEELQFDLCSASSDGSSVCHTYCDMGHPFITVLSDDP